MKQKRIVHNIVLSTGLAALGVSLWWVVREMVPIVAGLQGHKPRSGPLAQAAPAVATDSPSPTSVRNAGRAVGESSETRVLRADVVAREQALAVAQESALANLPDAEQASALAAFSDAHRLMIAEAAAAQDRFLKAPGKPTPPELLPGAEAANARFAAVRRALIEEGLSLEDAEAPYARAASDQ